MIKKRIALVVNSLSGGGAERTAANLSRALSDRYEIDIIVNDDALPQYPYQGNLLTLQMPVCKNRMNTGYQITALLRRIRLLKKLKRQRHYMAALSFSEMTNLANVLTGGKAIISVRNSVKNSRASGWKYRIVTQFIFPYMFHKACKTVSCSKEIAEELVNDYGLMKEKSAVIYNGIDLEEAKGKLAGAGLKRPCSHDKKLIVSVGRLTRQKGQWHLIRAIKKLRDDGWNIRLVILGEGELRSSLEQMTKEGALKDSVVLPGFVDNPEQFLANADAVVFPSLYEGFSNAIVEALACGAPVISTDHVTGAREILAPDTDYHQKTADRIDEEQYGILVPVCDGEFRTMNMPLTAEEQLMEEAIRRILTNEALANHYRQSALLRAHQLSLQSVCQQWIRLIEEEPV